MDQGPPLSDAERARIERLRGREQDLLRMVQLTHRLRRAQS